MDRDELQAVMDDKNLTPSELAKKMGISPVIVSRWRNGVSKMSAAKDKELRRVLDGKPPRSNADTETDQLIRENNNLLRELLATRDTEITRLKKRISTLEATVLSKVQEKTG